MNPRPPLLEDLARRLGGRERRVFPLAAGARDAAVLLPLCLAEGALSVLFTLRTDSVPTHKGQVAFPGGGRESGDADLVATALRETEEELGVAASAVDVLGLGDDAFSITGMRVTPVVGWLGELPAVRPSPREIADVFTLSVEYLRRPDCVSEQEMSGPDGRLWRVPFFHGGRHPIWGLTAWMLREVLNVMEAPVAAGR